MQNKPFGNLLTEHVDLQNIMKQGIDLPFNTWYIYIIAYKRLITLMSILVFNGI